MKKEKKSIKNPLTRRLFRELKSEAGKYLIIFLFLIAAIGFVSGFLVADGSMKRAYDDSFDKFNIEDGHFILAQELTEELKEELEEEGVRIYENYYLEEDMKSAHTIRIFKERGDCNAVDLLKGKMPSRENQIAIDRLYAGNNGIAVGDELKIQGKNYEVSGFVAFSDYSALFKNNTDMMFDAQKFTVAVVTEDSFEKMDQGKIHYCYSWRNTEKLSEKKSSEKAEDLLEILGQKAVLTDFVKRADNQAIQFTGDDMGSDKAMITWMLYIIIAVLAFIFAVTIGNTIEKESAVIGTLRAMGYTKGELVRHYLVLPIAVSLSAALIGNIIGYTCMKEVVVGMYYGSYSLPAYQTIWNGEAFFLTTVIPCLLMLAVNLLVLLRKLSCTPLQFLRHDLKKSGKRKAVRLRKGSFQTRFRIRIILQNKSAYFTMFLGIMFANLLVLFGMMMAPLLAHYKDDIMDSSIAKYQYILKAPVPTAEKNAEPYAVTSLKNSQGEEVTVFGITEDSEYLDDLELPEKKGEIIISNGLMEKYGLETGDKITLKEVYSGKKYKFKVAGSYHYPPAMTVFLSMEDYHETFDLDDTYFNGYFTNNKIEDIDETLIGSVITEHDLTIIANQLDDSMGNMFFLFLGFAVFLYCLILLLLSKIVVEKNALSISMVKILGYSNREIGRLYSYSTTIVVVISLLVNIPLAYFFMKYLYIMIMMDFNGWMPFYVEPSIYPKMFLVGFGVYLIAAYRSNRKIRHIPMQEALKNME